MTTLTRSDIAKIVGNDPKLIRAFEQIQDGLSAVTDAQALNVVATQGIQNATALVLSPNNELPNARVVEEGSGISLTDQGGALVIALAFALNLVGGKRLTINLVADTNLSAPNSGTVMVEETPIAVLGNYASDAAAAAGGVQVQQLYRNGNAVQVRVS